ncbi:hypothetical protein OF820_10615 [Oceanotoga sp. DSM 15011]|uniref:hypothetical protein n=1 Tax=Oceanotoga sp. DSM 15011 TaxID=2984951 RepID=UPI0021F40336|nr:hypothetical protein [Oceanotoga sp. DSM 15011]UYO99520.1 hypothetical protein OF820_10615 [Oceanotoga sp. DSM 15011]
MEYTGYKFKKINKDVWEIDDIKGNSMYLIEGNNKSLLIDTGMMPKNITPMIKKLTKKILN